MVSELKAQQRKSRERFAVAQRLENEYLRSLRQLTRQIDHIVKGMTNEGVITNSGELQRVLRQYAVTIEPWAQSIAERMLLRIAKKDESAWIALGREMGKALRKELNEAPIGDTLHQFMQTQVHLITSLPIEAADRVHKLTTEGITQGTRVPEIMAEILKTGSVTESRAKCIARTEIARTASGLTLARAAHVGCTHYTWVTSGDVDVRKSHKEMNGAIVPFATAPKLSDGTQTHAGMIYNCRCWMSPIFTD